MRGWRLSRRLVELVARPTHETRTIPAGSGLVSLEEVQELVLLAIVAVDTDGDALTDEEESDFGTDPSDTDTDGDGWSDLSEVNRGRDPLDSESYR